MAPYSLHPVIQTWWRLSGTSNRENMDLKFSIDEVQFGTEAIALGLAEFSNILRWLWPSLCYQQGDRCLVHKTHSCTQTHWGIFIKHKWHRNYTVQLRCSIFYEWLFLISYCDIYDRILVYTYNSHEMAWGSLSTVLQWMLPNPSLCSWDNSSGLLNGH